VPTAEKALFKAPGVLAVKVDYELQQATIGTKKGEPVSTKEILAALKSINYRGRFSDD
tara:strand:- start:304 stop:477 length:174 start_codon:yes stop_codon:yes gene_type:complete